MSWPRPIVRGATTSLCRRTILRKAFLAPWHPLVTQTWLYALADAQRHTQVAVHSTTLVINHHHTHVTPTSENLPDFTQRVHEDVSKGLNVLLLDQGFDRPRQIWDQRSTHQMRLLDAASQASDVLYGVLNCVAAGLVASPSEIPGWTFDFGLWKQGALVVERPPIYFGKKRPRQLALHFEPPPELYGAFGGDIDRLIHHMRSLQRTAIGAIRRERRGKPVLGATRLRSIHAYNEPASPNELDGYTPSFKVGAAGLTGRQVRARAHAERRRFRSAHACARHDHRHGKPTTFPYGTYKMRVEHNAPVGDPAHDALYLAPGKTLADVKTDLASKKVELDLSRSVVSAVRSAFKDEAEEVVRAEGIELTGSVADDEPIRRAPCTTKRGSGFEPGPAPRRLVTLRDLPTIRRPTGTDPPT
ncbi:MAG: hypothetical protein AAGE52_00025 [Myxococcota bacterium]